MSGFAYIWNIAEALAWTAGGANAKPRLEWSATDADSGDGVAAYRVRIYSDGSGTEGGPDMVYDSGERAGNPGFHDANYAMLNKDQASSERWWTIKVKDNTGEWSLESSRTAFKVCWGQAIYQHNAGASSGSWSWDNAAVPAGTQAAFLFADADAAGANRTAWVPNIGQVTITKDYLNVLVRLATYTSGTQPNLSDMTFSYAAGGASTPDNWTRSPSTHWSLDFDSRRYGVKAIRCVVSSAAYHYIEPFRKTAGDGIAVAPNTDYVFSGFINTAAELASDHVIRLEVRALDPTAFAAGDLKHGLLLGDEYEDGPGATNDTSAAQEGWQRIHIHYRTGPDETAVRPVVLYTKADGSTPTNNGDTFWVDALKWEEGTVVSAWTPGFLSPAVVMDSFGIQIAAGEGGSFGLRKADGTSATLNEIVDARTVHGTFTPVLTFATAGDQSIAYSTQTASYTKIGTRVYFEIDINTSTFTHTTAAGNLRVSGLPFAVGAVDAHVACNASGWTRASHTQVSGIARNGQTYMEFLSSGSGQALSAMTVTHWPTAASVILRIAGSYSTV